MSDEQTTPPPPAPPPAAPAPQPRPAKPPKPPRKPHGCVFRLFVFALVLLLIGAGLLVGVQWALQNTDYARKIALPIVERELGLRLDAKGLKVSLLGHTELTEVSVGLPLDEQDFLHVKSLRVRHANLLQILIDRAVTLDEVTIDQPIVDVTQDKYGRWNLLRVADILGRLGGSTTAQPTATSGGVPKLPAVHLVAGVINIDDGHGHKGQVAPLNVNGSPKGLLVWNYDLAAGPAGAELLTVKGVVAPGGDWVHRVTATVGHLDPLAKQFGVDSTYAAAVVAQWNGQLSDGKVGGRLQLQQVVARGVPGIGDVSVTGAVDVATGGPAPSASATPSAAGPAPGGIAAAAAASPTPLVTLSPSNLQIVTSVAAVPTVGVVAGQLVYDSAGLHTRGLKVNALGGAASVDLSADPKSQNVDLAARWTGLTLAAGIRQGGSLTASLRQPFPGQPVIKVELDDQGRLGDAAATAAGKGGTRWDAALALTGQGSSWTSIDWVLGVPRLKVDSGEKSYDLSGISATVQQRPTTIDLLGLTLPPSSGATSTVTTAVASSVTGRNAPAVADPAEAAGASRASARSAVPAANANSPFGLTFAASAHVDLPDKAKRKPLKWTASASGGVLASYQGSPLPVAVNFDANGDDTLYTLRRFTLSASDATVRADGSYDNREENPRPLALHVALTQAPRVNPNAPIQGTFGGDFKIVGVLFKTDTTADPVTNPAVAIAAAAATASTEPATTTSPSTAPTTAIAVPATTLPTTAPTTAPVQVKKWVWEPYLTTTGQLQTTELVVLNRPVGDINIQLAGDVRSFHPPKTSDDPDAPAPPARLHVNLEATEFALLQAPWAFTVEYPNADDATEINLSTRDLQLDVLARAATGMPESPVQGRVASAHWRLTAAGLGLGQLDLTSDYKLADLRAAGLVVDTVDAGLSFHDGVAKLEPVVARSGPEKDAGRTDLSVTYALAAPTRVRTHVTVKNWPYPLGSALGGTTEARANADVDLGVDLKLKGAVGNATAGVDVILHPTVAGRSVPQTLAHAQVAAEVRGRTVTLDDLSGKVLNGTFQGSGQLDVGKPLEAAGRLQWQDVDAAALFPITGNKNLADLGGIFSGTVTVAPTRDPRPLEPVRIDVNVAAHGGHYGTVKLGDDGRLLMTHAVAYANVNRAVLDHSDIFVAGGVVHVWGRVGTELGTQAAIVDYRGLSLDQLAHAIPGQADGPVPGQLQGELRIIRNGSGLNGITGGGPARIVNADLIHIPAIGTLYKLTGHDGGGLQPGGRGGLNLAIEAGSVRINGLRFLNRGLEAKGLLTVGPIDTADVKASALGGQVVGTLQDLKGSRLPLISDFNDNFAALQSNLTTLNVRGTLGAPKITAAGADEIGSGLRELLVGDAQKQQAE